MKKIFLFFFVFISLVQSEEIKVWLTSKRGYFVVNWANPHEINSGDYICLYKGRNPPADPNDYLSYKNVKKTSHYNHNDDQYFLVEDHDMTKAGSWATKYKVDTDYFLYWASYCRWDKEKKKYRLISSKKLQMKNSYFLFSPFEINVWLSTKDDNVVMNWSNSGVVKDKDYLLLLKDNSTVKRISVNDTDRFQPFGTYYERRFLIQSGCYPTNQEIKKGNYSIKYMRERENKQIVLAESKKFLVAKEYSSNAIDSKKVWLTSREGYFVINWLSEDSVGNDDYIALFREKPKNALSYIDNYYCNVKKTDRYNNNTDGYFKIAQHYLGTSGEWQTSVYSDANSYWAAYCIKNKETSQYEIVAISPDLALKDNDYKPFEIEIWLTSKEDKFVINWKNTSFVQKNDFVAIYSQNSNENNAYNSDGYQWVTKTYFFENILDQKYFVPKKKLVQCGSYLTKINSSNQKAIAIYWRWDPFQSKYKKVAVSDPLILLLECKNKKCRDRVSQAQMSSVYLPEQFHYNAEKNLYEGKIKKELVCATCYAEMKDSQYWMEECVNTFKEGVNISKLIQKRAPLNKINEKYDRQYDIRRNNEYVTFFLYPILEEMFEQTESYRNGKKYEECVEESKKILKDAYIRASTSILDTLIKDLGKCEEDIEFFVKLISLLSRTVSEQIEGRTVAEKIAEMFPSSLGDVGYTLRRSKAKITGLLSDLGQERGKIERKAASSEHGQNFSDFLEKIASKHSSKEIFEIRNFLELEYYKHSREVEKEDMDAFFTGFFHVFLSSYKNRLDKLDEKFRSRWEDAIYPQTIKGLKSRTEQIRDMIQRLERDIARLSEKDPNDTEISFKEEQILSHKKDLKMFTSDLVYLVNKYDEILDRYALVSNTMYDILKKDFIVVEVETIVNRLLAEDVLEKYLSLMSREKKFQLDIFSLKRELGIK